MSNAKSAAFGVATIAAFLLWGAGQAVAQPYSKPVDASYTDNTDEELVKELESEVEQINQQTPMMMDEQTRLDKATLGPGATVTYHFTFPSYSAEEVDRDKLANNLSPALTQNICLDEQLKESMEEGARYVYAFHGNDGREISRMEVKESDCG